MREASGRCCDVVDGAGADAAGVQRGNEPLTQSMLVMIWAAVRLAPGQWCRGSACWALGGVG
jgi:hypothetical protein